VCGNIEAGSDSVGMEEYGFCECEKGHYFCDHHVLPVPEGSDPDLGSHYGIPAARCPICMMTAMDLKLECDFYRKVLGWSKEEALAQAKARCETYEGFLALIGKKA
jgi:hypothetical protein